MADPEEGYGLEMPFLTVASRGGPHEDAAYTAGWEMGALDAELTHRAPALHEQLIHAVNAEQADLIGMRNGYSVEIIPVNDEWASLRLTRTQEGP